MKKIFRYIKNKIRHSRNRIKIREQVESTSKLRAEKRTDESRWKKESGFYTDWNERTEILGSMIKPGAKVIEFGAGHAFLRNELPEGTTYTPSDIIKRDKDFLVCDLNKEIEFDLTQFDTVVFSGVLEYVYDLEKVFDQFPENITTILLSYSSSDVCMVNRFENGWLSDYSKNELEIIFRHYDYIIMDYMEWRKQSIYQLVKKV